jgi:anti-anti-sigma regulatory factor
LAEAQSGNHICYVAEAASVSADFLGAFARRGAGHHQRVVWLTDAKQEGPLAQVAIRYARGGDGSTSNPGAVVVRSAEEVYLDGGDIDVDRVLSRYRAEVTDSLDAGYTGLRVLADTSWLWQRPNLYEEMLTYEERGGELFADDRFAAVCHYDPEQVPATWLRALAKAHPLHADPDTPGLAAGTFHIAATPGGVRLAGEVDFSNAGILQAVLAEIVPAAEDLHVDLSGLDFIDVAGTRAFVEFAESSKQRLVLHDGPRSLQMVLETAGWTSLRHLVADRV